MNRKLKVAIMSLGETLNYGDILFAPVLEKKIKEVYSDVECKYFTSEDASVENIRYYQYSEEALDDFQPNLIIACCGEFIHKHDNTLWRKVWERSFGRNWIQKPSNTFFGWLDRTDAYKAWFGVGILDGSDKSEYATEVEVAKLNHCSTRGIISKKILERNRLIYYNPQISITPDIGWSFPEYFGDYLKTIEEINCRKKTQLKENSYICFSINYFFVDSSEGDVDYINNTLQDFKRRTGLEIVLLSQQSNHQDIPYLGEGYLYFDDLTLQEKGALLCGCKFYIGYGLHFAITAMANGKPASVIHHRQQTKFQDLFGHMMRTDWVSSNWNDLPKLLDKHNNFSEEDKDILLTYVSFMRKMFVSKLKLIIGNCIASQIK